MSGLRKLRLMPDSTGAKINAISFPNAGGSSYIINLLGGTEYTLSVPENASRVLFSYSDSAVYVSTQTISLPATDAESTDPVEISPANRILVDQDGNTITTLYLLAPNNDTYMGARFFIGDIRL